MSIKTADCFEPLGFQLILPLQLPSIVPTMAESGTAHHGQSLGHWQLSARELSCSPCLIFVQFSESLPISYLYTTPSTTNLAPLIQLCKYGTRSQHA